MQILEFYSLDSASKWAFLGYETLFIVVFFSLAWTTLVFVRHEKR